MLSEQKEFKKGTEKLCVKNHFYDFIIVMAFENMQT